ncbi:MAG TPA: universal stress protein [Alphaproteobacteria bacterium]|nr:universal stress protein [Alphaproteobacteria bacterium]
MFNHILAPIDGSGHAIKAAEMATQMALTYGAKLTLLHVARRFAVPEKLREYLKTEQLSSEDLYDIDEATHKMIGDIRSSAEDRGLKAVKTVFKEGKPSRTIVGYAERHDVDAIIMGSRGLTDIEGALLGSVSHKVASLAACTVIIVK